MRNTSSANGCCDEEDNIMNGDRVCLQELDISNTLLSLSGTHRKWTQTLYALYSSVKHFAEICTSCGYLITDMVLQALGKSFHPDCFCCVICKEKLEGQVFSVDTQNKIYCVKDYHRILAQTCAICEQLILPNKGSNEIVPVMFMGKSYHVACYEGKSNI